MEVKCSSGRTWDESCYEFWGIQLPKFLFSHFSKKENQLRFLNDNPG
jgi:hypothetical protein